MGIISDRLGSNTDSGMYTPEPDKELKRLRAELQNAINRIDDMTIDPDPNSYKEARKWAKRVAKQHGLHTDQPKEK